MTTQATLQTRADIPTWTLVQQLLGHSTPSYTAKQAEYGADSVGL